MKNEETKLVLVTRLKAKFTPEPKDQHKAAYALCADCGDEIVYSTESIKAIIEKSPEKTIHDIDLICDECATFRVVAIKALGKDTVEVAPLNDEQAILLDKLKKKYSKNP